MIKNVFGKLNHEIKLLHLMLHGFKYQAAVQYLRLRRKHPHPQQLKTILRLLPFHNGYDKMLCDILSVSMVLQEKSEYFAVPCAVITAWDGQKKACMLSDPSRRITTDMQTLIALLRNKGALLVRAAQNMYPLRWQEWRCESGKYYIDRVEVTERDICRAAEDLPEDTLLSEYVEPSADYGCTWPVLHIVMVRSDTGDAGIVDEYISDAFSHGTPQQTMPQSNDGRIASAHEFAAYIGRKFYELPYMHLMFLLGRERLVLVQFDTGRDLPYMEQLPAEVEQLLKNMQKVQQGSHRDKKKTLYRYYTSWQARRKGFVGFMYRNWLRGLADDNKARCTTRKEKRWAHQRGFYSYRIRQYHLTEENYRYILSDYDYKRLRPLNCRYHHWLWDKQMLYDVLRPFRDYLPTYYCRLVLQNGRVSVIPYDPACEIGSPEDIIALLRQKGKLALKPAVGSHGEGFCQLAFAEGNFLANGKKQSEEGIRNLLGELKDTYIVSEYIEMHHDLKRIYDKVACTIRVMTIQNGTASPIKNAYFRIGTSFTGNTDNLGSGGIAAPVDLESGRFEKAELLVDHEFTPCEIHPDTGVPVRGQIPHWEEIKAKITEICTYLRPLEYLGFDIVVTDTGFKILEINTHQDLHKYTGYPQEVKDYFAEKLVRRKIK